MGKAIATQCTVGGISMNKRKRPISSRNNVQNISEDRERERVGTSKAEGNAVYVTRTCGIKCQ